jgi:hypothetical protein
LERSRFPGRSAQWRIRSSPLLHAVGQAVSEARSVPVVSLHTSNSYTLPSRSNMCSCQLRVFAFAAVFCCWTVQLRQESPLWSSRHSSWLQIQKSRVRLPAPPHYLRSTGSGTVFTEPPEDNWGAAWMN